MSTVLDRQSGRGLAALRRLAAARRKPECCELCAAQLGQEHQHLVDRESRRLLCSCDACAILFDHSTATRYRRVPRDVRDLSRIEIDEVLWNSLGIPVGLVFLFRSSVTNSVLAVYPSPGGPTETSVADEAWSEIAALDPALKALSDDVEALLANRTGGARRYYIVPIDECYKLTGIIRRYWTGLSGGDELWEQARRFFERLEDCARPAGDTAYA